jgi:hypothetical protein
VRTIRLKEYRDGEAAAENFSPTGLAPLDSQFFGVE